MKGDTILESGPGLRNWITPESADGFGMAVAAWVGGRFSVGRGSKVSVEIDSEVDSGVGLASGRVGESNSKVGKLVVAVGMGSGVGTSVFGKCARVGKSVGVAGTQAGNKTDK